MKYFVTSDIHGYYDVLITALKKAGYDNQNKEHHLIVVGDMFDRGDQSDKVLEYLYRLYQEKKATIILGNHDSFLLELFDKNDVRVAFNIQYNGFAQTLISLSGYPVIDLDKLDMIREMIQANYPYLESFLRSLPYYYELDEYIFVHGGVDGRLSDWRNTPKKRMMWNREIQMPKVEGRIVVSGHHRVATIRNEEANYTELFQTNPEAFDILYEDGKILIDRYVEVSKELNVLLIEK